MAGNRHCLTDKLGTWDHENLQSEKTHDVEDSVGIENQRIIG